MRKNTLLAGLSFLIAFFLISCEKENGISTVSFIGEWKTSYGDTISFARINGKNMIQYRIAMNPALPPTSNEYTYRNKKLGVKDGFSSIADFRFFQSFRWLVEGQSFEVQGVEWFPFMSSTTTYFTFTKIK